MTFNFESFIENLIVSIDWYHDLVLPLIRLLCGEEVKFLLFQSSVNCIVCIFRMI